MICAVVLFDIDIFFFVVDRLEVNRPYSNELNDLQSIFVFKRLKSGMMRDCGRFMEFFRNNFLPDVRLSNCKLHRYVKFQINYFSSFFFFSSSFLNKLIWVGRSEVGDVWLKLGFVGE